MSQEKLNITQLAKRFGLDRVTVASRLEEAEVPWVRGKKQEKLFDLEAAGSVLVTEEDESYDKARARKVAIEADLKELDLAKLKGELLPAYEVRDQVQRIVQRLYQKFAIQQPKEIASRLAKLKGAPSVEKVLREEASKVFADLRRDHSKMLEEQG